MARFVDVIANLTESTDPQGDSDYIVGYDGASVVKYLINNLPFAAKGNYLTTDTALDALGAPSDSTSLDASTDAHGLLPKLSGVSSQFLTGVGTWAAGGGGFSSGDIHMVELYRATLTSNDMFDISSINQGYDHLLIYARVRSSAAVAGDTIYIYLNNDTTMSNYRRAYELTYDGGAYHGGNDSFDIGCCVGANAPAGSFTPVRIFIPNYTSTGYIHQVETFNYQYRASNTNEFDVVCVTWKQSLGNAITRVRLLPDGYPTDKFVTGSWIQVIGIKTEA